MASKISLYGFDTENSIDGILRVEREAIRRGGRWKDPAGRVHGKGLLYHYLRFRKIVWPKRYEHEWTRLMYENFINNQGTVLMGCASSQKTSHASEFVLISYWCWPENTLVLISSTTWDKLESAIFGEIKSLWGEGTSRFNWLAGNLIDSRKWIVTDDIEANKYDPDNERKAVRDVRRGILCKACYTGRSYVGLGVFAGIKQERLIFLCDELQFMAPTVLDCLPNMRSNSGVGGFKFIGSGNPNHEPRGQLTVVAEPKEGWSSVEDIEETTVWDTNFTGIKCLNLIGTDSPNFRAHREAEKKGIKLEKDPYHRLIGPKYAEVIANDYGANSPEFETHVKGRMKLSLAEKRVITREICRIHKAHEVAIWKGTPRVKIHGCDPAYGRGDRCIQGHIEFGEDVNGHVIIRVYPPRIIKIDLRIKEISPEMQISDAISSYLDEFGISSENSFYDSFGKGTIGYAFSKTFGDRPPNPVDAGAMPTERPVRQDLFIEHEGRRRLKTCREHYSKFITEMWFAVRYAIEAEQMREIPMDVVLEGCSRKYHEVAGNKIEVEPKEKMRQTLGRSPDLFDWLAVCVEGARQRGFMIAKLGGESRKQNSPIDDWFDVEAAKQEQFRKQLQLSSWEN